MTFYLCGRRNKTSIHFITPGKKGQNIYTHINMRFFFLSILFGTR